MNDWTKLFFFTGVAFIVFIFGMMFTAYVEHRQMQGYDLYACIYNNAAYNNFNKHPQVIAEIEYECKCFQEYNWTKLQDANCTMKRADSVSAKVEK